VSSVIKLKDLYRLREEANFDNQRLKVLIEKELAYADRLIEVQFQTLKSYALALANFPAHPTQVGNFEQLIGWIKGSFDALKGLMRDREYLEDNLKWLE